jgi:hypothetical protein
LGSAVNYNPALGSISAADQNASLLSISVSFMSSSSTLSELSPLSTSSSLLLLHGVVDDLNINSTNQSGENKHVMFADKVGLQLELIHTIQENSVNVNSGTLMSLASPYEAIKMRSFSPLDMIPLIDKDKDSHEDSYPWKTLIAKFKLSSNETYESLMKNGSSLKIY